MKLPLIAITLASAALVAQSVGKSPRELLAQLGSVSLALGVIAAVFGFIWLVSPKGKAFPPSL